MTTTFIQLVQDVADDLGLRANGTLTASATNALTCATYPFQTNRTDASTKKYEGVEVYDTTASSTAAPNPNGVSAYAPSTGVFTPSKTYSVAPGSTATFDLYLRGVSIVEIRAAINQALRNLHFQTWAPLTYVTDGDMDTTGTTAYTATTATLSKVTAAGNVLHGSQALRVLATSANGQARSTLLNVDPDYTPQWFAYAHTRADVGTARLVAYDNTNAATITSADWNDKGWGLVAFTFGLPATCLSLALVARSVANADDTYWDDLIAFPMQVREFPLPSWVVRADQVIDVRMGTEPTTAWRFDASTTRRVGYELVEDLANPNAPYRLTLDQPTTNAPLFLVAHRQFPALSADTDTTVCDREWLIYYSCIELLKRLKNRPASEETAMWRAEYVDRLKRRPRPLDTTVELAYSGTF